MNLNTPVAQLSLIGPIYAKRLEKLGLNTLEDLLLHIPHRYNDFRLISKIASLQSGETVTVQGEIISCQNIYTPKGLKIQKALVADNTGQIEATWFNQPFIPQTLKPGLQISLSGKVVFFGSKKTLSSPEYEIIKKSTLLLKPSALSLIHTGRLVPVYPETRGVSSKWLRSRIAPLLKLLPQSDHLPSKIKTKYQLLNWTTALKQIHFPKTTSQVIPAQRRLAFDELFLLHLATLIRKARWQKQKLTHALQVDQEKILLFINQLPFELTSAQKQAVKEILKNLNQNTPMNRLLEGDVGSGKTIVAAIAIYTCYLNNFQSALMAPTQILAQQHAQTLTHLLQPLGVKIQLVTSGYKLKAISHKLPAVLVGTHALLHQSQLFNQLALVIIDEQHRFGVEQRAQLLRQARTQKSPHLLTMTATPIPRSIALTLYGNLDLSVIDQMPPGRQPIKTWVTPLQKRASAYRWISGQIQGKHGLNLPANKQAFIVCPLIEQSDSESLAQVKAATVEYQRLKHNIFPDLKLDLLHGKLTAKQKNQVIQKFAQGKTHILVSTPVVEVGIDVPNASIMVIEAAERFGLAQLHQLRGRVGRRGQQGYCLLFSTSKAKPIIKRLKALETETSGLKLAEIDLKLRGPGEIHGTQQHGFAQLKIASFSDTQLIAQTHQAAEKLLTQNPSLNQHPQLKQKLKPLLSDNIQPN